LEIEVVLPNSLMARGSIDAFDLMLGQKIQAGRGQWLGIYLSKAFRQGHMAIAVTPTTVEPSPEFLFSIDGEEPLEQSAVEAIAQAIISEAEQGLFCQDQVSINGHYLALPHAHAIEISLAQAMARLCSASPSVQVVQASIDDGLNPGQKAAVMMALHNPVCVIIGGPGTGKTYTAGAYLRALARSASTHPLRVALLAPTGRAVQALEASILRAIDGEVIVEARTIHSALTSDHGFLPYHVVIIDECSMIGSALMGRLVQRLHSGTRVVMLGDPHQLPPIDPGQPFFDLVKASQTTHAIAYCELIECRRTASDDLITLARTVREADAERFVALLSSPPDGAFHFLDVTAPEGWRNADAALEKEIISGWRRNMTAQEAMQRLRAAALLTTGRSGPCGTERLNARAGTPNENCSPVLCVKNSYQLGVMNGDLGVLERRPLLDQIHFHHVTVPAVLCPKVEEAYAMTIHKSQGSEFDSVVVLIPPGALCDRRLLYTAVTRAKERVVLIGQKGDVVGALTRCHSRVSQLPILLNELLT
jgi:exodeoxyribonuclease V alpha subunit